jgi:hypothetical protein
MRGKIQFHQKTLLSPDYLSAPKFYCNIIMLAEKEGVVVK